MLDKCCESGKKFDFVLPPTLLTTTLQLEFIGLQLLCMFFVFEGWGNVLLKYKVLHVCKREDLSLGPGLPHVGCVTEAVALLTRSNSDTSWVSYNSVLTLTTWWLRGHFRCQSQVLGSQVIHTSVRQTRLQSRGFPPPAFPTSDVTIC